MSDLSILRPRWFSGLDFYEKPDRLLMNRYFIKKAALLASPEGTIDELAKIIDYSKVTLSYPHSEHEDRGIISERLALRLQKACGAEKLPLKLIRPDLF